MLGLILALAVPLLLLHLGAVGLSRALRVYSPSLLQDLCRKRSRAARAEMIAETDDATARAADVAATLTGLVLAGLLGVATPLIPGGGRALLLGGSLVGLAVARILADVAAHAGAESILDKSWPAANVLRRSLSPVNGLLRSVEARAYNRSHLDRPGPRPPSVELELPPSASDPESPETEPDLPPGIRSLLGRALTLANRAVDQAMTPRSAILALPATLRPEEAARSFIDSGFSRIPLYGQNRDDIVGILHAKDLFARMVDAPEAHNLDLRKLARAPLFVPETKNAAELLDEMRGRQAQMAVVLDEYGGVAGLITIEDLLEELVGEIHDEYDIPEPTEAVVSVGGSHFEVDAALPIEELNERLGLHLPTDDDFSTVGGLAFSTLGHLPEPGATFARDGVGFTVLEVEGHSIRRLRIELQPAATAERPL